MCVNVEHLFLGTARDNAADMVAKARQATGERVGRHKLTAANVAEIRELLREGIPSVEIAPRFGVGRTAISAIKTGRNW
jgi:hypothetical protein